MSVGSNGVDWKLRGGAAALASVVAWGWVSSAKACLPDPCEAAHAATSLVAHNDAIAPDGVLAFSLPRGDDGEIGALLPYVTVQFDGPDGVEVAGDLEVVDDLDLMLWRPADLLEPSMAYTARVRVDNAAIDAELDGGLGCGLEDIDAVVSVPAGDGSLPELPAPQVDVDSVVETVPTESLDALVCCDGAMPRWELGACGGEAIEWDEGSCVSTKGRAFLDVAIDVSWPALTDAASANFVAVLSTELGSQHAAPGDASYEQRLDQPGPVSVVVRDLARGTQTVMDDVFVGGDVADQLGARDIDPTPALDAQCAAEPYVCETFGDGWDHSTCIPWDDAGDADDDGGDSGDTGQAPPADDGPLDSAEDPGLGSDDGASDAAGEGEGLGGRGCSCRVGPNGDAPLDLGMLLLVALAGRIARRPD